MAFIFSLSVSQPQCTSQRWLSKLIDHICQCTFCCARLERHRLSPIAVHPRSSRIGIHLSLDCSSSSPEVRPRSTGKHLGCVVDRLPAPFNVLYSFVFWPSADTSTDTLSASDSPLTSPVSESTVCHYMTMVRGVEITIISVFCGDRINLFHIP